MEFIFAYLAGVLTLINPCVLPVLPIILVSALNASKAGPIALALGMSVSFIVFGVLVTAFGSGIGLTQERLAQIGAALMIVFGAVLIVPAFAAHFERATAHLASNADSKMNDIDANSLRGQFLGGYFLAQFGHPVLAQP